MGQRELASHALRARSGIRPCGLVAITLSWMEHRRSLRCAPMQAIAGEQNTGIADRQVGPGGHLACLSIYRMIPH